MEEPHSLSQGMLKTSKLLSMLMPFKPIQQYLLDLGREVLVGR
jgi:hypothetical protein